MGLLFGKKKSNEQSTPVIHKTQHNNTAPRVNAAAPQVEPLGKIEIDVDPVEDTNDKKRSDYSYNQGASKSQLMDSGASNHPKASGNTLGSSLGNSGGHNNHNLSHQPASSQNLSAAHHGSNQATHLQHSMGGGVSSVGQATSHMGHNQHGAGPHGGGPGGHSTHAGNISGGGAASITINSSQSFSPVERVVNLYAISQAIFNIARLITVGPEWANPEFSQNLLASLTSLDRNLRVLRTPQELRDWVHPLHYRKTGAVIGAGRRITIAHNSLKEWEEKLKLSRNLGANEQRYLKETFKEVVSTFVQLCVMVEMVVPADFNGEINELARTMRDLVDTASGKLNYVFDDVAHICTTCSVRLSRLGMWKGLQVVNLHWARQINDTCFTVSKATKVLYVIGQKLYENMTDRTAYDNLTTLTRGIVVQIKKLQEMVQHEPPNANNMVITFTNEIIQEHLIAYDAAIKEVSISLNNYVRNNTTGETDMTINSISKIITQLEVIKESVRNPDNNSLFTATAAISEALEKFCASVYHVLHLLGDQNEVIKEQVMETMQQALHGCLQLQLVAVSKGLYHNVLNPENTMLICVRFLLLSVSIIIDAVDFMRGTVTLEDDTDGVALGPEEINDVIVYILHYGRALYRGDVEAPGQENNQIPESNMPIPSEPQNIPVMPTVVSQNTTHSISPPKNDDGFESVSENSEEEIIPIPQPAAVQSKPVASTVTKPVTVAVQSPPLPAKENNVEKPPPLPVKPEPQHQAQPAGVPAHPPAAGGAQKSFLDMTTPEFKAYCDANGKPTADFNENKLPPGFEKPPTKPVYKEGSTREEYKAYMVAKYEYETWENKLVLFNIKLKKKLDEIK